MADHAFWHNLQDEFTRLIPAGGLRLDWMHITGKPGHCEFTLVYNVLHGETLRLRFEALARRAGAALNELHDKDSLEVWFSELKARNKDPRNLGVPIGPEVMDDGRRVYRLPGSIPNVCQASVNCCVELEIKEMEAQRQPKGGHSRPEQQDPKVAGAVAISAPVPWVTEAVASANDETASDPAKQEGVLDAEPKRQAPAGATELRSVREWGDLTIAFLSEERVGVNFAGAATETRNYEEMGFGDGRGGRPRVAWQALLEFSGNPGKPIRIDKKRAQEIRGFLRKLFVIDSDPLLFTKGLGYLTRFNICRRSSFDS